ncbi:hypothetical protein [Streptomyces sp. NPDC001717]
MNRETFIAGERAVFAWVFLPARPPAPEFAPRIASMVAAGIAEWVHDDR